MNKKYLLGANRMRKKALEEIKEWWYTDETHINSLLRRIKKIKVKEL